MKSFGRCLIASFVLTLALAGWILFIPTGSTAAFVLMFPAIWLTATHVGGRIATSDSGATNFVTLVLASTVLNTAIYGAVFFGLAKVWSFTRGRQWPSR